MSQKQSIGTVRWFGLFIITVCATTLLAGGLSYYLRPELNYALGAGALAFGVSVALFLSNFGRWFKP